MAFEMSAERRKQLLRATEEMVTAHRIEAITREHASIANLLDHREIFELDEIQINQGKFVKIEADSRVQSRRGARAEAEIKPIATQAVDSFKEKGINVQLLSGGYDLEIRIWKEKSSQPAYAEQRKFQYPELESFLAKMPKEQKMEYKQKVGAAIIKLAEKFREECKQLKADMDLNGIFHPEANAHRVHCIYLTMLHKHISAKTVETPVLKEMYREEQKKRREEAARDEEKAQMLREMEERDRNAEKMRSRMMRRSMDMSHGGSSVSPSGQPLNGDGHSRNHEGDAGSKLSTKKKTGQKPTKAKSQASIGASSSLPNIHGATKLKTIPSVAELPSSSSGGVSSPQVRKEKVKLEPPEKTFKRKLRQTVSDGQVNNVFNQDTQNSLLSSEVAKLQQAETIQFKRPKDRTDAWAESMSQWMLQDLQSKQVSRVAAGTVSNVGASLGTISSPSRVAFDATGASSSSSAVGAVFSGSLNDGAGLQLQQQVTMDPQGLQRQQEQKEQWTAFGKAAVLAVDQFLADQEDNGKPSSPFMHHLSPSGGMRGVYSPTKYVDFDQFYNILKTTADPLLEAALTMEDAVLLPASLAATQALQQTQQQASHSPPATLRRVASMNAALTNVTGPPAPLNSSISMTNLGLSNRSFLDPHSAASSVASTTHLPPNTSANAAATASSNTSKNNSNSLNIVDVMRQEIEPRNFVAYEKVQDLTLPSAKLLARLNGTAGHRRSSSHLGTIGHTAIELRDSFGRMGRNANKGFDNLFSSQRLQEKGLLATKDHRREDAAAGTIEDQDDPFMDDDDVVRRLERTGDLGERTRGGKMRTTDMDAMLDDVSNRSAVNNAPKNATGNVSFSGGSPVLSRSNTPHRRRRGAGSPSRSGSPSQRHRGSPSGTSPGKGKPGTMAGDNDGTNEVRPTPLADGGEDDAAAPIQDEELDLQHKLVATWDTLGVTANDRLAFMLKYSADVYAAEMSRAIDLWAGATVCHVMLQRLMGVREKAQQGLLLVPLSALELWRHIIRPVPSLLRLNHEALIPPTLVFVHSTVSSVRGSADYGSSASSNSSHRSDAIAPPQIVPPSMPFSVQVIIRMQHIVCAAFAQHIPDSVKNIPRNLINHEAIYSENASVSTLATSVMQEFHVDDVPTAQAMLHDLLRNISNVQQVLLLRARSDFDDEIPCGHNRYCRDFLQQVVTQLDREQEAKALL